MHKIKSWTARGAELYFTEGGQRDIRGCNILPALEIEIRQRGSSRTLNEVGCGVSGMTVF